MLMSDQSHNWGLETLPIETRTCPCCEEQFQLTTGMVYDDKGKGLAMYIAFLTTHSGVRRVPLHIGLLVKDHKGKKLKEDFACRVLWVREGKVVTSVVTDPEDPLGRLMTRAEALKSPFLSLIFEVDDFILEKDPHIRPFLEGDTRGGAQAEGKE
jgi:hypothetical protein